jgi:hypothetical protein
MRTMRRADTDQALSNLEFEFDDPISAHPAIPRDPSASQAGHGGQAI